MFMWFSGTVTHFRLTIIAQLYEYTNRKLTEMI